MELQINFTIVLAFIIAHIFTKMFISSYSFELSFSVLSFHHSRQPWAFLARQAGLVVKEYLNFSLIIEGKFFFSVAIFFFFFCKAILFFKTFKLFILYWGIAHYQCCGSEQWRDSAIHIHMYPFSHKPTPIQAGTSHWTKFHVLSNSSLFVIYFKYSSVYMTFPIHRQQMLERVWREGSPPWWECKLVQPLWKVVWRSP